MSRKYISELLSYDFVYPNNTVSEYDLEIVHDINNNSVNGTVNSFSATTVTTTGITFSLNYTWNLNNAEPWIRNSNQLGILSVHMLTPDQDYFKPWRVIQSQANATITTTTFTATTTFSVTPAQMGVASFIDGTYYFEVRFIGHRAIYPVCLSLNLNPTVVITPTPTVTGTLTPTPTPSSTGPTATPTPSPTMTGTLTPTPTVGSKSLEVRARDVASTPSSITMFYSVNGGGNINLPGGTGTIFPVSCTLLYTIPSLTTGDIIVFGTSISCVMDGNGASSTCPSSSSSMTTYTYVMDAPTTQQVSLTIDTDTIP
jgi:hypothetical protein